MKWVEILNQFTRKPLVLENLVSLILVTTDFSRKADSVRGIAAQHDKDTYACYFGTIADDAKRYDQLADYLVNPEGTLSNCFSDFRMWLEARTKPDTPITFVASDAFGWTNAILDSMDEQLNFKDSLDFQLLDLKLLYAVVNSGKNPAKLLSPGDNLKVIFRGTPTPPKQQGLAFIKSRMVSQFPILGEGPRQRAGDTYISAVELLNMDFDKGEEDE